MRFTEEDRQYVDAVAEEIRKANEPVCHALVRLCTECGMVGLDVDRAAHLMIGPFVIVACEGYWMVNPNLLPGYTRPNWSDWRDEAPEGVENA